MTANIVYQNDSLMVSGGLNFATIMDVWKKSLPLLEQSPIWNFDLSQVTVCDSAALALLFEWKLHAKKLNKPIQFKNISNQIMSIATAANVASLLSDSSQKTYTALEPQTK